MNLRLNYLFFVFVGCTILSPASVFAQLAIKANGESEQEITTVDKTRGITHSDKTKIEGELDFIAGEGGSALATVVHDSDVVGYTITGEYTIQPDDPYLYFPGPTLDYYIISATANITVIYSDGTTYNYTLNSFIIVFDYVDDYYDQVNYPGVAAMYSNLDITP